MPRQALCELPLERFLPPIASITASPLRASAKRTLSPIAPSLYSPTKRRVLDSEGVYSPQKSIKGLLETPVRAPQSRLGPGSPARRLEFGEPQTPTGKNPIEDSSSSIFMLAPSPELTPKSRKKSSASSSSPFPEDHIDLERYLSLPHPQLSSTPAPTIIRQAPLPPPDRRSLHYPGFDVYQETTIVVSWHDSSMAALVPPSTQGASDFKENMPPRIKARKSNISSDAKSDIFSSPSKGDAKFSVTPNRRVRKPSFGVTDCNLDRMRTPRNPRSHDGGTPMALSLASFDMHSPGKTPSATRLHRLAARQLLVDEGDGVQSDVDDDDDQCF